MREQFDAASCRSGYRKMPDWKSETRRRLASLKLEPAREAAIVEELAQYLEDCYAELLAGGVAPGKGRAPDASGIERQ
jgi:hypothetical protein